MVYLSKFSLLNELQEEGILFNENKTYFNSAYPFRLFQNRITKEIHFSEVNIFYGSNGSGKSTILDVIAEKLKAVKKSNFNKGMFFDKYVDGCDYKIGHIRPNIIKKISSNDVFDYVADIKKINNKVEKLKDDLFDEYMTHKYNGFKTNDYEDLKKLADAKKKTLSRYVRDRLNNNTIIEQSNGEYALMYFEKEIEENGIYILDEPENSLSAESQLKLAKFIEDSARYYNCQFIISTHSPFLLAINGANIYDLDSVPVKIKKWYELRNVELYYDLFKKHEDSF